MIPRTTTQVRLPFEADIGRMFRSLDVLAKAVNLIPAEQLASRVRMDLL
jgi:hypothetical protein